MMSEKRFVCIDIGYGDDWYITDNGERLSEMEIVDLLNKQDEKITVLQNSWEISEKRFVIDEEGISDNKTDKWYCWKEEVVDLLNEQQSIIRRDEMSIKTMMSNMKKLEEENKDLREVNKENQVLHEENVKQCEKWKNLYELKDSEVTARVDTLNRVCNYYLSETRFKGDTDPNEAVKEVINEILNAPIYEEV